MMQGGERELIDLPFRGCEQRTSRLHASDIQRAVKLDNQNRVIVPVATQAPGNHRQPEMRSCDVDLEVVAAVDVAGKPDD